MKTTYKTALCTLICTLIIAGCSAPSGQKLQEKQDTLVPKAQAAIASMTGQDSTLEGAMNDAYAYAVFPTISTGALILGGAGGDGIVFQDGAAVAYVEMGQGTIGAQIGGGVYSEIILLKNRKTFENFMDNQFTFAAQATATAIKAGAAEAAKYSDGVAVLVMDGKGLMAQAAVGGQKFTVTPFE